MLNNYKLFVLDDDLQYAELLVDLAQDQGWEVDFETDPLSFLDRNIEENTILVLDLFMPKVDGIEVIRTLAERQCNIPLILMSGFDNKVLHSAQQLAEAHDMIVIDTITKPFNISQFIQLLNNTKTDFSKIAVKTSHTMEFTKGEIEYALINEQFVLHYQPQININNGEVTSLEALVRWQHPNHGLIYPDKFIWLVEQHNLIELLTRRVIYYATRDLKLLERNYPELGMSVNVTADNITSLFLPEQLKKLVDESKVPPSKLTLELTESAVMGHLTSSLDVLNRLRMKGFHLSIDDFGTGYSSLQQLYQAPFNELKIDRTFVSNILKDKEALVIVEICIMLAQTLNMKTLAEGVESQEILAKLKELNCDLAQGYHIAKPMPFDALQKWLIKKLGDRGQMNLAYQNE